MTSAVDLVTHWKEVTHSNHKRVQILTLDKSATPTVKLMLNCTKIHHKEKTGFVEIL